MAKSYNIKGFPEYEIVEKILYRKSYKTKSKTTKWQYRNKRVIQKTINNGIEGYILVKNKKRKWYSLSNLRTKLIENENT